jgi:hypothetical protein
MLSQTEAGKQKHLTTHFVLAAAALAASAPDLKLWPPQQNALISGLPPVGVYMYVCKRAQARGVGRRASTSLPKGNAHELTIGGRADLVSPVRWLTIVDISSTISGYIELPALDWHSSWNRTFCLCIST